MPKINKYMSDNYPKDNGLICGRFILRNHNDSNCIKLMESWWNEIELHSARDQISFNYVSWKNNSNYVGLNIDNHDNEYYKFYPHPKLNFYDKNGIQKINIRIIKLNIVHKITSSNIYKIFFKKIYNYFKPEKFSKSH